jgi:nickel/cobalt exporter
MKGSFLILLLSTLFIGFFHSLAPDHWVPFVMIGRSSNWSKRKLTWVTFLSGIGHVGSSILLGSVGILLGLTLSKLQNFEGSRGQIAVYLLIGFGVTYTLWGLRQAKKHSHHHHLEEKLNHKKAITVWALMAIFVLGPCEPLIPLMFLATQFGWKGIWGISIAFSIVTIFMMITQTLLAYAGVKLIKTEFAEKYTHSIAGAVIALTGVFVLFLGI